MSIPSSLTPLFNSGSSGGGGLQIERSIRLNSADSAYLGRTPGTAGNRTTWTWSGWVKRSAISSASTQVIFDAFSGNGGNYFLFQFTPADVIQIYLGPSVGELVTTSVYRDASAWYHFVLAYDTTQATPANRIRLYVNNVEVTTFSTATYPSQNNANNYVNSTVTHHIGTFNAIGDYFNGYLTNIHHIDGQQLTPSSFTETDATTGQLIPKTYTGSYGTNGFNLLFADNSAATASTLGKDTSPNGNNWTPNNLSTSTGGPTSVAAATGALPVFNTTDTYGTVKGTGTRTDTNSASIVLALPMDGANNGTSFGDQSAVIKGSGSAKTVTVNGNAKTSTAQSKFYGSSGLFDGTGDFLDITPTTDFALPSDFTIEAWAYNPVLGNLAIFSIGSYTTGLYFRIGEGVDSTRATVYINSSQIALSASGSVKAAQWNHFAVVRSGSAVNIYVNGVSIASGTSSYSIPAATTYVGRAVHSTGEDMNGYVQDVRVYKGVAKYTSSFNPPSSTANPTVAAANDSLVDSPTNYGTDTGVGGEVRGNYCTLNPLDAGSGVTISDGNLRITGSANVRETYGTLGVSSGKWYFEATITTASTNNDPIVSVARSTISRSSTSLGTADGWGLYLYALNTFIQKGSNNTYTNTNTTKVNDGDVIGIAFDVDAGKIWASKNGTWIDSGIPSTGSNPLFSNLSGTLMPGARAGGASGGTTTTDLNFGQRAFAYTAPSGFKALCTQNLPAPLVAKSNTVMDVVLYTGNGSAQTISGLGFSPDLVWIKSRSSGALEHNLVDTVRGTNAYLYSNSTRAEQTISTNLTAFNSDGFSLGTGGDVNTNSATFVGWAWDAGTSTVSNTAGSITSQVRANATAGFSVITWTGNATLNATIGHGLGVAPLIVIIKNRSTTTDWLVYTSLIDGTADFLKLNTTAAKANLTSNVATSSLYSLDNGSDTNGSGNSMVAYAFAPVVGYSSFGSYTGNGSADGPFVYTGFRPKWVMIKGSSFAGESWFIWDTSRNTYNQMGARLLANEALAENSDQVFGDILSNGFKLRNAWGGINTSSATYIYAAFAEMPFNYSRAR
jgi:Concanavalin A-like lectin/glucanases superfamily/SPRY domain